MQFHEDIPFVSSPNFSSRVGNEILGTVIHYTAGGSADGTIHKWFAKEVSKASSHFVIARGGDITQMVDLEMKAWHAGNAEMVVGGESRSDPNRFTIGIELANHGLLQHIDGEFFYELGRTLKPYKRAAPVFGRLQYDSGLIYKGYWEPYPDEQISALQGLLAKLSADARYKQAAGNLIGHEEIGMPLGRKKDPGALFPWGKFSQRDRRTAAWQ